MKKSVKIKTVLAVLAVMMTTTGCTTNDLKKAVGITDGNVPLSNVSVVMSPTANEPKPNISLAEEDIYNAIYSRGVVSVTIDDGKAFVIDANISYSDDYDTLSHQNKASDTDSSFKLFKDSLDTDAIAVTPEKDTAKAIKVASAALEDCEGDKKMILIDNGISTSGIVNFTESGLSFDYEDALSKLNEYDLANLSGVKVVWYDMGSTIAPQESLSNENLNSLRNFWTGYLEMCGVASEDIDIKTYTNRNKGTVSANLPPVSVVAVTPEDTVIEPKNLDVINTDVENAPDDKKDDIVSTALDEGVKIDETRLNFEPESSVIANKEAAIKLLKPTADCLINTSQKVIVLGTTATVLTSEDKCVGFSLERANAVKSLLVEMGVDESQINCKGLGYDNEFHITDLDSKGNLNENAPKNRAVLIYGANSEIGKKYTE